MPEYRDRNNGYVPEGLFRDGIPQRVEIGHEIDKEARVRTPIYGEFTHGLPDELNRKSFWQWADVSGDGSHWAHFDGHRVQIDVSFHTENRREVNDWKGRDEIRAEGVWTLALNRQQCWEGFIHADPLASLREIPGIIEKLLEHPAIVWADAKPAAEQLMGRRLYYDRTPAVVSSVSVLDQGCVMLKPVDMEFFPPAAHSLDDDEFPDDPYDRREIKVDLLAPNVWWWRDRRFGDEPAPAPKKRPESVPADDEPA